MSESSSWVTRGFDAFMRGQCGNSGQNLYVSKSGVLQRIHQFDITGNGYIDLIFCNAQNHWEQPPSFVYTDPLKTPQRLELHSRGAQSGALADLNGDGMADLVLGFKKDGIHPQLNALVYYGTQEGITGRFHQELPAPMCRSVAVGDAKGSGRPAIAFMLESGLRMFYQTALGFELKSYDDLEIFGNQICFFDLDRDGYDDLIVRSEEGALRALHERDLPALDAALHVNICRKILPTPAESGAVARGCASEVGRSEDGIRICAGPELAPADSCGAG